VVVVCRSLSSWRHATCQFCTCLSCCRQRRTALCCMFTAAHPIHDSACWTMSLVTQCRLCQMLRCRVCEWGSSAWFPVHCSSRVYTRYPGELSCREKHTGHTPTGQRFALGHTTPMHTGRGCSVAQPRICDLAVSCISPAQSMRGCCSAAATRPDLQFCPCDVCAGRNIQARSHGGHLTLQLGPAVTLFYQHCGVWLQLPCELWR
jgi:hypothetical protein